MPQVSAARKTLVKNSMRNYFLLNLLLLTSSGLAAPLSTTVPANGGKTCRAYLYLPEGSAKPLPLAFAIAGTGIYSESRIDEMSFGLDFILDLKKVAVLEIDKPGIIPVTDETSPDYKKGYTVDPKIFSQYTIPDLIECAANAITWARTESSISTNAGFLLLGHSEGAMVIVRLYERLLQADPALAKQIQALILSGTPLDSMKDIINAQLAKESLDEREAFWRAYKNRDDAWLIQEEHGATGADWLDDAFASAPLAKTLNDLADLKPLTHFEVYQGLEDQNVPADSMIAFEKQNLAKKKANQNYLNFDVHYFSAGHGLNASAGKDIVTTILSCINGELPFCKL